MRSKLIQSHRLDDFQRYIYENFINEPNSFIPKNYIIDERKKTLYHGISHYSELPFLFYKNNEVVAGYSINLNCYEPLQCERMGFHVNRKQYNFCEALLFFLRKTNARHLGASRAVGRAVEHLNNCFTDLFGLESILATCSPSTYEYYSLFGWSKIDSIILYGKPHYLIKFTHSNQNKFGMTLNSKFLRLNQPN